MYDMYMSLFCQRIEILNPVFSVENVVAQETWKVSGIFCLTIVLHMQILQNKQCIESIDSWVLENYLFCDKSYHKLKVKSNLTSKW